MSAIDERRELLQHVSLSAVSALAEHLDEGTIKLVNEFIENFEFGVALEWLCGAIEENGQRLRVEQWEELDRLAKMLDMELPLKPATENRQK